MAIVHMLCPIFVWQISPIETCSGIGSLLIRVGTATVEPSRELDLISASWSESGKRWRVLPDPLPDEFDIRKHSQWRREEILMESKGHPEPLRSSLLQRCSEPNTAQSWMVESLRPKPLWKLPKPGLQSWVEAWCIQLVVVFSGTMALTKPTGEWSFYIILPILVGGLENVLFSRLGISQSQLTNSIIFQRGRSTTNQHWHYHIWGTTIWLFNSLPWKIHQFFHR